MPFSAFKIAARLVEDPVRVLVAGKEFPGAWFSFDADSDVFTPADMFSMKARVPSKAEVKKGGVPLSAFREGNTIDIYIGDDRQMAGVIDDCEIAGEPLRLSVQGRDKGGFLVDNETKALHFSDYNLKTLAEKMLLPEWGIRKVIVSNEDNRKVLLGKKERDRFAAGKEKPDAIGKTVRKQTKLDQGQRISTVLDEHCRRAGVTWWITAQGDLFIGKPQYDQSPRYEFLFYAPESQNARKNNILSDWRVHYSIRDRYSDLTVVGQTGADSGKNSNLFAPTTEDGAEAKKFRASVSDPDLKERGIARSFILFDCDALSNEQCQKRAEEEMQRRRLQGQVIRLTAPGFKQNGTLFAPDALAKVVIEEADIDGVFWIGQRRFREESGQRRTEITLYQKGVYLP